MIAVALIILIPVLSVAGDPLDEPANFSSREFSTQVFLNENSIGYNISKLEDMVSQGSANRGFNGSYIYRSHHDQDLYVMIRWFNLSGYHTNLNLPINKSGPLITIGIPVESVDISLNMEYIDVEMDGEYFGPDQRWLLHDLGYHVLEGSHGLLSDYRVSFGKEDLIIALRYDDDRLTGIRFMANEMDSIEYDANELLASINDKTIQPLSNTDIEKDRFDPADKRDFTWSGKFVEPTFSPEDVEWEMAMKDELKWLQQQGIVNGLDQSDVEAISKTAKKGLAGPNNMILSFRGIQGNEDPHWVSYMETTFPLITGESDSDNDITIQDIPTTPTEDGQFDYTPYIALIIPAAIIMLIAGRLAVRYKAKNLLKNANRKNILEIVKKNHGIHFRELMRLTDLKQGSLSYHLNKMEKAELVKSRQDGMYRRFYPYNSKVDFRLALSDLQKDILMIVQENPGINQSKISKRTGRNHVLVHYHANFLREAGMLWMEKSGRETKLFLTEIGIHMASS